MNEAARASPAPRLEAAFTRIWTTRMEGLAFLNRALRVEAVGFRQWQDEWLGALVTPWSVNLVLMPGGGQWTSLPPGGERIVSLPAGRFRFIAARDEELGEYHACSLLSPVAQFADHDTARVFTEAALLALFDPSNAPGEDGFQPTRPEPASRRDFLRGRVSGSGHGDRG